MAEFIYGHWAVMETLRAGKRNVEQLLIGENIEEKGMIADIINLAKSKGVKVQRTARRILDDLANGANHQNTVVRASPYAYADTEDILSLAQSRGEKPFILVLDLLKDPQNVGVLLRVAESVGIHGILIQERRSVAIVPSVVNASSGAVEYLHVAQVNNLVNTMKELKEENIWMVGLEADPNIPPIDKTDLNIGLGLVLGSEGEGMRRLVRDTCDMMLSLPMRGHLGSLNVATAGSIALYTAWQARGWEGWSGIKK